MPDAATSPSSLRMSARNEELLERFERVTLWPMMALALASLVTLVIRLPGAWSVFTRPGRRLRRGASCDPRGCSAQSGRNQRNEKWPADAPSGGWRPGEFASASNKDEMAGDRVWVRTGRKHNRNDLPDTYKRARREVLGNDGASHRVVRECSEVLSVNPKSQAPQSGDRLVQPKTCDVWSDDPADWWICGWLAGREVSTSRSGNRQDEHDQEGGDGRGSRHDRWSATQPLSGRHPLEAYSGARAIPAVIPPSDFGIAFGRLLKFREAVGRDDEVAAR